jgi:dTDP-4-amino-4,6-dideoxy-D-galactose acyltransferase
MSEDRNKLLSKMKHHEEILELKKKELFLYTPYNFLRDIDQDSLTEKVLINPLLKDIHDGVSELVKIVVGNREHYFIYKKLEWDSNYFGFPVFKVLMILYNHEESGTLNRAINKFAETYISRGAYWFFDVPDEDLKVVQALGSTKFRMVETRLNFYLHNIQNSIYENFPVRLALKEDIQELRDVAIKMRNRFDRVHSDPAFTSEQADAYLATFVEQSIKGFADIVLVPDVPDLKPFGFLAGNKPVNVSGHNIAKLVLTAVDGSVQRGWLFKLLSSMICKVKEEQADIMTTNTQAANRASISVWEKAGFKLSFVTHIFSTREQ